MADPANGFYIQDKPGKVPNGIARTKEDYGEMTISDRLDADDINDNVPLRSKKRVPFDQTVGQILAFHRNVMSFALLDMNATNACITCNTGVFV